MKRNYLAFFILSVILTSQFYCKKEKSFNKYVASKQINQKDISFIDSSISKSDISLHIDKSQSRQIDIDKFSYLVVINVSGSLRSPFIGVEHKRIVLLNRSGIRTIYINNFISKDITESKKVDLAIANAYIHSLGNKVVDSISGVDGYLAYYNLAGKNVLNECIRNGLFTAPVATSVGWSTSNINTVSVCRDWYWVTYYPSGLVTEDLLFSDCDPPAGGDLPGGGSSSGGGSSGNPRSNISSNLSSNVLLCASSFNLKATASNWQAAYVTNYRYIFVGVLGGGTQKGTIVDYEVNFSFEVGLPFKIKNGTQDVYNPRRLITNAWNYAEQVVAEKITAGGYSSMTRIAAQVQIKKDLMSFAQTNINRNLGVNAATVGSLNTLTVADGVNAVYIGPNDCP
ncbi:hypothetical protein GS399_03165 [Pedobacter sp. HMF7647]|uniref:Uncharacterized protein n=1 Tax=Hufsiella arboris TaxID=2695275 RepID=A0A7K1Y7C2_9SPHI|nr:hypothetical protein [Hufsiella arboris]MXV49958.1 hypothetical protein [Hufsiella arboris]